MAKIRPGRRYVDSYTIAGTNKIIRAGDCVFMRPSENNSSPYVARVEKIEADHCNDISVRVRWYCRPEKAVGGRRHFHGAKELFLSDYCSTETALAIEGKCNVHTLDNYTELENVGVEDYYCRFEYETASGTLLPDRVPVYCNCEMPINPDELMIQCEECEDWYHPACVDLTIEHAEQLDRFVFCSEHRFDGDAKNSPKTPLQMGW